jgi:hypothetical protein
MYNSITVDRNNYRMLGANFKDLSSLNITAAAIGSNMYEGFEPNERIMELYIASKNRQITDEKLIEDLKNIL